MAELRTLIALTLQIIDIDGRYIPPSSGTDQSTHSKLLKMIQEKRVQKVDEDYYKLADEIIKFFQELPSKPEYATIMKRKESSMIRSCIDVANQSAEVMPVAINFAVMMPAVKGTLNPKKVVEKIKIADTVLVEPGNYLGEIDVRDRYFVKLVQVTAMNVEYGGNGFVLRDRNNNLAFFYEKAEKLKHHLYLGDCFSMYATPLRHDVAANGEKYTIFITVELIDNKGPGADVPDPSFDSTGLFSRT